MKKFQKIGTLRKNEYGPFLKLDKGVEIFFNGEKIDLGEKQVLNLQDPRKLIDYLEENGHITATEAEKRRERLKDKDWLRYEIIVPPQK